MKNKIEEPLEGIQIGNRIIQVTAKKASEIRLMIAARRGNLTKNGWLHLHFVNKSAYVTARNYQ
jgi:hypothetical protein